MTVPGKKKKAFIRKRENLRGYQDVNPPRTLTKAVRLVVYLTFFPSLSGGRAARGWGGGVCGVVCGVRFVGSENGGISAGKQKPPSFLPPPPPPSPEGRETKREI